MKTCQVGTLIPISPPDLKFPFELVILPTSSPSCNIHGCVGRSLRGEVEMRGSLSMRWLVVATLIALFFREVAASLGDHLPDFRECVKVGKALLKPHVQWF